MVRSVEAFCQRVQAGEISYTDGVKAGMYVPLGQGDVDWPNYLGVLEEIEYRGWLTVECKGGSSRSAEGAADIGFLGRFLGCPRTSL